MDTEAEEFIILEDCQYIRIVKYNQPKWVLCYILADDAAFLLSDYSDLLSSLSKDGYFVIVLTPDSEDSFLNWKDSLEEGSYG